MIKKFGDGRDWFFEKKLGMFVHWGLYAIPAWHEQILWRSEYPRKRYERLVEEFNPTRFDPDAWIDAMQAAGMEFICFTTKHHDGFCMWDTKYTEYNVMNTPYGKDVLAMLAEACTRRGVKLGLYYSLPDWHHPNYPNIGRHHEMFGPRAGDRPDERAYLEFVRGQLDELLTKYGPICQFFWDVNVAEFADPSFNETIRRLQSDAVINDRGPSDGDFSTPEREIPAGKEFSRPTQACQAMGRESWGFREDEDYYSVPFLAKSISTILAMGGSYLLNVGPKADGTLADENVAALARLGDWYRRVREAFDGTVPCSSMIGTGATMRIRYEYVFLTRRGNTFYALCPGGLETGTIVLPGFEKAPRSAKLLNDGRSLRPVIDSLPWRWKDKPCLCIRGLPVDEITGEVLVVRFEMDEKAVE